MPSRRASTSAIETDSISGDEASSNLHPETWRVERWWRALSDGWSEAGCGRVLWLVQIMVCLGIVAATTLQLVAAMEVRGYAKRLLRRDSVGMRGVLSSETVRLFEERRRNVLGETNQMSVDVDEEKMLI